MIEEQFKTSPDLEKAKQKEQEAREKRDKALKALSEQKRKFENRRKYFIGGTVHKYFKDCFLFEDNEIDWIIKVAFETIDVKRTIEKIRTGAKPPVASPVNVTTTVEDMVGTQKEKLSSSYDYHFDNNGYIDIRRKLYTGLDNEYYKNAFSSEYLNGWYVIDGDTFYFKSGNKVRNG